MRRLNDQHMRVLQLFWSGYSTCQIARLLDKPEHEIEKILHRARERERSVGIRNRVRPKKLPWQR